MNVFKKGTLGDDPSGLKGIIKTQHGWDFHKHRTIGYLLDDEGALDGKAFNLLVTPFDATGGMFSLDPYSESDRFTPKRVANTFLDRSS